MSPISRFTTRTATTLSSRRLQSLATSRSTLCSQCLRAFSSSQRRSSHEAATRLVALRKDLKAAMQAKDTDRLNVLRALLADITNASKTDKPVQTNPQFVSLLRKRLAAAERAVDEFKAGGRQDLVEKEEGQIGVLKSYLSDATADAISPDELEEVVTQTIEELKAQGKATVGEIMNRLLAHGGKLVGRGADGKEVGKLVRQLL